MVGQIAQNETCLLELKFSFECIAVRLSRVFGNKGLDAVQKTRRILFKTEDKIQLSDTGIWKN